MCADTALTLDGATKRYRNHLAVDNLSLSVPRGCVYGLLGPNGAGKTTTMRMVCNILIPDFGSIRLFDGLTPGKAAARCIGYLPEERGLYPKMKILELLAFFGELHGLSRHDATARAKTWLERLQLGEHRFRRVEELSKGMQQKIQFITAVLHDPELLILDEPLSGLDPVSAEVILDEMRNAKKKGVTIVLSTHQMEQAESTCDLVCIINKSKKVVEGSVVDLKRQQTNTSKVVVSFSTPEDESRGEPVLSDPSIAVSARPHAEGRLVELAQGVSLHAFLSQLVRRGAEVRLFEVSTPSLRQIFVERVATTEAANA